ncbi:hypothetical protein G4B88_012966 [Cannabis sativa]|uniref:Uncharacterized protein n=1 Tax=Cannabis sativa TaxID=3483 RepID=A0A7J6FHV5_CANSA|nr:hypothetical protein G4B88_012966 [Cannabis sativa]
MSSPMGALMLPMIQNLESTLRSGAVPQVPQFRPGTVPFPSATRSSSVKPEPSTGGKKSEGTSENSQSKSKTSEKVEVKSGTQQGSASNGVVDVLGDARSKVQEEITAEFAAIMATGTLRASEAAALATRRVMQKHGHLNSAISQN